MEVDGPQGIIEKPFTFTGRVAYANEQEARMIRNALAVDAELRPELVTKELTVEGSTLVMRFCAADLRTLRAAVGTFCDLLALATRTLEAFRPRPAVGAAVAGAAAAAAVAVGAVTAGAAVGAAVP